MSFITANHCGGLGNAMFKLASAISTAIDNNVPYIFSNEFVRPVDVAVVTGGFPDYRIYYDNILRGIQFIDKLPEEYITHGEPGFHYTPIQYQPGTNLLLAGYFQSEKYFLNNKQTIMDLYGPPEHIKEQIRINYPEIGNYASIHVRRGDYLYYPDHHPQQSKEYYEAAVNEIGIDKTYMIFSDDLEGCKDLLDFIPNKHFFTSNVNWMDMYIMSMCSDNIICNSTFSWWGAWLNQNPNKKVIAPNHWFGPAYHFYSTQDLIPESWIKI